jgi:hypothetical protein
MLSTPPCTRFKGRCGGPSLDLHPNQPAALLAHPQCVTSFALQGICFQRPETRNSLVVRGLKAIAQLRQQVRRPTTVTRPSTTSLQPTCGSCVCWPAAVSGVAYFAHGGARGETGGSDCSTLRRPSYSSHTAARCVIPLLAPSLRKKRYIICV